MIQLIAFLLLIFAIWAMVGTPFLNFIKRKIKKSPDDLYKIIGLTLMSLMFILAISLVFPFFIIIVAIFAFLMFKSEIKNLTEVLRK